MKKLVAAAVAVGTSHLFAAMGPSDYIQDGLVALYDAEFNATNAQGGAIHDVAATTWVNLVTGTGDLTLPTSGVTIDAKAITLDKVTAVGVDCSAATQTGPVTLETCARSVTTSTSSGNNSLMLVTVVNRAGIGLDARSNQSAVILSTDVSDFTKSKNKYIWFVKSTFSSYASVLRTYSGVVPVNGGNLYANGLAKDAVGNPWTAASAAAPTGELTVGNTKISVAYNCIRIYNRELTEDERQYNNAVDAVRFRGADPATAITPYAYSYDAEGKPVQPEVVTVAGTTTIEPGSHAKGLVNKCVSGAVTFDETGYPVTADATIGFTGFDALADALTVFRGGWWDFGGREFFSNESTFSNRTTVFDGAVVKNVGRVWVAGSDGADNTLVLTNGAAMSLIRLGFGNTADKAQRSKVLVTSGSSLECTEVSLNDVSVRYGNIYRQTGNELRVSGEGSRLTVGSQTLFGLEAADGYGCGAGGSLLSVTDGAVAELGALKIANKGAHGVSNRVEFARGAKVDMASWAIGGAWWGSVDRTGGHDIRIVDGTVVTNRGVLTFGANYGHDRDNHILISNAVFHTASYAGGVNPYLIGSPNSTFTLSGPNAAFTFDKPWQITFAGPDSSFIIENGAKFAFPVTKFSYTGSTRNETLLIRTGAEVTTPKGTTESVSPGDTYSTYNSGLTNAIVVESGAKLTVASGLVIAGKSCKCEINDGTVTVGYDCTVGSVNVGTNALMNICGRHPYLFVSWNMYVSNDSALRFTLPADGYDGGWATEANPLIYVGSASHEKAFQVDVSGRFEFAGAEEMLAWHRDNRKRGAYVLLKSSGAPMVVPDTVLAAAQASLPGEPGEMTFSKYTKGGNHFLTLTVKPKFGMMLLVR